MKTLKEMNSRELFCVLTGDGEIMQQTMLRDIIRRLKEYEIEPLVTDNWADPVVAKREYGVDLVPFDQLPKADCVIVAVGHSENRAMSMMQLKALFKEELADEEKVLIDVKSLYRMDELKASRMRFWRL